MAAAFLIAGILLVDGQAELGEIQRITAEMKRLGFNTNRPAVLGCKYFCLEISSAASKTRK